MSELLSLLSVSLFLCRLARRRKKWSWMVLNRNNFLSQQSLFFFVSKTINNKGKSLLFCFVVRIAFVLILIHCLRPYTDSRWWWTFLFVTLVVGPRLQHKHTGRRLLLPTGNSFHNPPYYYRIFHPPSSHLADAFTLLFLVVSSLVFFS